MNRDHLFFMRRALRLARRGFGATSPNPMVGAVLVKRGTIIGEGWHRRAGEPHAEVEAIRDAQQNGSKTDAATLYVTLEPCCTRGRTPPCTDAIIAARIKRVVVGTTDPNPKHKGRAFRILRRAGIDVVQNVLADQCAALNETFNHWIVNRTPFVTVKAAMSLDGKIATTSGKSKWITGATARLEGNRLRRGTDAILVGVNTIIADDPQLTVRNKGPSAKRSKPLRRIVLDSQARTPLEARVVSDENAPLTTVVVSDGAPRSRVTALAKRVSVVVAPLASKPASLSRPAIDLRWLLRRLGKEGVTSLLVEGGGEVNASFLLGGLAHRVAFFYAPKILGGRDSLRGVAGVGATSLSDAIKLDDIRWRKVGPDLLLLARVL